MKNLTQYCFLCIGVLLVSTLASIAQTGNKWDKKTATEWFNKREWLTVPVASETTVQYDAFGRTLETAPDAIGSKPVYLKLEQLKPHTSIDVMEFAKQFANHKDWWSKAFQYMQETDLASLRPGKYTIDGDNVFATVTEGPAKMMDTTKFESHRNYQDIHYVIKGKEKIGVAPVSAATIINPYDTTRDLAFYKAAGTYHVADPGNFFIFFPGDAHRPNLQINRQDTVKKLVIKIKRGSD